MIEGNYIKSWKLYSIYVIIILVTSEQFFLVYKRHKVGLGILAVPCYQPKCAFLFWRGNNYGRNLCKNGGNEKNNI